MIGRGTILVEKGAALPDCLRIENGSSGAGSWAEVKPTHPFREFEQELEVSGWTFFYLAKAMTAVSFGSGNAETGRAAVRKLIVQAGQLSCNCLEVDDVAARSFLGIPYVRVSAHPRHIQRGMVFGGPALRASRPA